MTEHAPTRKWHIDSQTMGCLLGILVLLLWAFDIAPLMALALPMWLVVRPWLRKPRDE